MHGLKTLYIRSFLVSALALQFACGDSTSPAGPGSIVANSPTVLTGTPGTLVAEPPSVIVRGQSGSPMGGVTVTFAVTSGGGMLSGGSTVTDANGVATVGSWTLGGIGANTVTASAAGLPPVTFTATVTDVCTRVTPHTLGTTTNGELTTSDCLLGTRVDFYSTSVATAGAYLFTQVSTAVDTYLVLFSAQNAGQVSSNDGLLAANDDSGMSTNSSIKALLPAGNFTLAATSYGLEFGPYALTSASTSSSVANCEEVFIMPGVSTAQSLETTDCVAGGFYSDDIFIFLRAGQVVTISMSTTAFDGRLDVFNAPNSRVATHEDPASGNARIVFTAAAEGYHLIAATSTVAGANGAYTLTIQ